MDNDITFYVRTELGDASHGDPGVTMSPAFRRMLRELDGSKSVSDLAPLFPHLDAEDLGLWLAELLRQKMIRLAPGRAVAGQYKPEAARATAASPGQPPVAQRSGAAQQQRVEHEVRQIALEIQPWLNQLDARVRPPDPDNEFTRTARMAAVEASTTANSIHREGFFLSPGGERQPLDPDADRMILVVEDVQLEAQVVASILSSEGYQVRLAASAEAARAVLLARPVPDLLLLDVELPDTNGFTFLKQLRAHPFYHLLRVVMLTGRSNRADFAKGILLGADGYLTKPFRAEMIKLAVHRALNA